MSQIISLLRDARKAMKQGSAAIAQRQRIRFAEMVSFVRANSPYYRELYQGLPDRIEDPTQLPVTSKQQLMPRFDDWVVDRDVTLEKARKFIENPSLIGEKFLSQYTVATTSGTTGTPGIFVLDDMTMAVVNSMAYRMLTSWLNFADMFKLLKGGCRMSMVMATGGHFASATAAARLTKGRAARRIQVLSVHTPMQDMVAKLNSFRPVVVAPYASIAALLAGEQEAGRLRINPVLLALSAEGLPQSEYGRVAGAFGAKVGNSYAACECPFLSFSCGHGWLHVNADWVLLEPVDAEFRPTSPGEHSHTVLLSNLANRVQPILRYDLGDSILQRPDPCPCGNPLPAIRVQGRAADMLTFSGENGERVTLPPLALSLFGDRPGIDLFQVVQETSTRLRVRMKTAPDASSEFVWHSIQADLKRLLMERKLGNVNVVRADESPVQSPGGKFRGVIPLK